VRGVLATRAIIGGINESAFLCRCFGNHFYFSWCGIGGQTTAAQAGDPSITPTGVSGEVKAIDAAGKQLTVRTDAGSMVTVASERCDVIHAFAAR